MYKNVTVSLYHAKWIYRSTPCSDDVMASASKGIIHSSLLCCKFTWRIYALSERLPVLSFLMVHFSSSQTVISESTGPMITDLHLIFRIGR